MTSQQHATELLRGWRAAETGQPFDRSQPSGWREGFLLRERTNKVRRPRPLR